MLKQPRTRSVSLDDAPPRQRNPFATFQICNPGNVWVSLDPATANRIARKATNAIAALVRAKRKSHERRADAQEDRRAALSLLMEQREADRGYRALWRSVRVPIERRPGPYSRQITKPRSRSLARSGFLRGVILLPRYSGAIIDRAGRTGIFFRSSYYGKASKPGVGRRATKYIADGALATEDGRLFFESNVGETPEEAMAALEFVELLNREAQSNGKALFHIIANVPYQLEGLEDGADRMFEIARRFAEHQYGSRNLPYAIALHPPSDEGDDRNWHVYILGSTRPMVRTGAYAWDVGEMLRREIDNPAAFAAMRQLYAQVQTEVVQEAGLSISYTALSNAARGLPNAPQKHMGGKRTAKVRAGERDPVNERNHEIQLAGEAALIDEKLRRSEQAMAAERRLIDRVLDRFAPSLPIILDLPAPSIAQTAAKISKLARGPRLSAAGCPAVAAAQTQPCPVSNLKGGHANVSPTAMPSSVFSDANTCRAQPLSMASPRSTTNVVGTGILLSREMPQTSESPGTIAKAGPIASTSAVAATPKLTVQTPGIHVPDAVAVSRVTPTKPVGVSQMPAIRFEAGPAAHFLPPVLNVEKRAAPAHLAAVPTPSTRLGDQQHMDQLREMVRLAAERDRALAEKRKKRERDEQLGRSVQAQSAPVMPSAAPAAPSHDLLLAHAARRRDEWMSGWNKSRRLDVNSSQGGAAPSVAEDRKRDGRGSAKPRPFPIRDGPTR